MEALETIKRLTRGNLLPRDEGDRTRLIDAYYELSIPEGDELAEYALSQGDRDTCENVLINLSLLVPGSLERHHARIAKRGFYVTDSMLRGASERIRDRLIKRTRAAKDWNSRSRLIGVLAWIGDTTVQDQLAEWSQTPPRKWKWPRKASTDISEYVTTAGWELDLDGQRRELCYSSSYSLDVKEEQSVEPLEPCPWCSTRMISPFDFDLTDPRLSFVGLAGQRIRILLCPNCTLFGPTFTDFDTNGKCSLSPANVDPGLRYGINGFADDYLQFWSTRRMVPAERRRSPFEAIAWLPVSSSQLGGFPAWIQYPEYPICPVCQRRMVFLAQFDYGSFQMEGMHYAFLCVECGVAATRYQAS